MADYKEKFQCLNGDYKLSEKQDMLFAFGSTQIEENIDCLFNSINSVEPQDTIYLFASLGSNLRFRNKIASLYISNFEAIKKHINNAKLLRYSLSYVLSDVTDEDAMKLVLSFLITLENDAEMKSVVEKCRDSMHIASEFKNKYKHVELNK